MDTNDLDFGNVPAWWGAITGTLALGLNLILASNAARERRRAERYKPWEPARQVTITRANITPSAKGMLRVQAQAYNGGDLPISDVSIFVHSKTIKSTVSDWQLSLDPKASFILDQQVEEAAEPYPVTDTDFLRTSVNFADADNYRWQKWADGELTPVLDLSPHGSPLWRWLIRRTVVGRLAVWWRRRRKQPTRKQRSGGK